MSIPQSHEANHNHPLSIRPITEALLGTVEMHQTLPQVQLGWIDGMHCSVKRGLC